MQQIEKGECENLIFAWFGCFVVWKNKQPQGNYRSLLYDKRSYDNHLDEDGLFWVGSRDLVLLLVHALGRRDGGGDFVGVGGYTYAAR
jgi:hypothetical protein